MRQLLFNTKHQKIFSTSFLMSLLNKKKRKKKILKMNNFSENITQPNLLYRCLSKLIVSQLNEKMMHVLPEVIAETNGQKTPRKVHSNQQVSNKPYSLGIMGGTPRVPALGCNINFFILFLFLFLFFFKYYKYTHFFL